MIECTCLRCCYARKHPQLGPAPHDLPAEYRLAERVLARIDIHAAGEGVEAACGEITIPQAPADVFAVMAAQLTEHSTYQLCQRCLAAVVAVH